GRGGADADQRQRGAARGRCGPARSDVGSRPRRRAEPALVHGRSRRAHDLRPYRVQRDIDRLRPAPRSGPSADHQPGPPEQELSQPRSGPGSGRHGGRRACWLSLPYAGGVQAHGLTLILNVSNLEESFAWFGKLGWTKLWEWGDPPDFGAVGSGP